MANTYAFNKKLQIASIEAHSSWHRFKVHTLMQNTKQKQPSINAYLGARYSRSADSIVDIAKEISMKGINASERLEMIFQGYGHRSVGDMAQLFICIENVPIFQIQRLFYMNAVHAGQERSTRFQNFEKPNYIKIPSTIEGNKVSKKLIESYDNVMQYWMASYRKVLEPTKTALMTYFKPEKDNKQHESALQARTFDMARSFLPVGLESSVALVMSARSWAELIGFLNGSNQIVDRELGVLLFKLLNSTNELEKLGYIPEADNLIRHTEANLTRENSTEKILKLLKKEIGKKKIKLIKKKTDVNKNFKILMQHDAILSTIYHYILILEPMADLSKIKISKRILEKIGEVLAQEHNHHNQIGTVAQTGSILIDGIGDYGGILKDINRHRSLERFFPLFSNQLDIDNELNRDEKDCFFIYEYLRFPQFEALKDEYEKMLTEGYKMVKEWKKLAKKELKNDAIREYTRYLLPHSHATRYRLYGSLDDWQYLVNLRTRNGGHIQYRLTAYNWLEKLADINPIFKGFLKKIPNVDVTSRMQFFDRT